MIQSVWGHLPEYVRRAAIERRTEYEIGFANVEPKTDEDWGFEWYYLRGEVIPPQIQYVRSLGTPDDPMDYIFGAAFAITAMAIMYRINPLLFWAGLPPLEAFYLGVGVSNLIQEQF